MTKRNSQSQQKDFRQLSVGDRVVHPVHGVGQVVEIKHQELIEGFEHYCVIQIPSQRLILHIVPSNVTPESLDFPKQVRKKSKPGVNSSSVTPE